MRYDEHYTIQNSTVHYKLWLISRAVIGQFQVRKQPYGHLALGHLFKRHIIRSFPGIINKTI